MHPRAQYPVLFALAAVALLTAPPARAAWQPDGVQVSPPNAEYESRWLRQLVADGSAGAYVVWLYEAQYPLVDGANQAYTVQRVDVLGNRPAPWPAGGTNLLSWFTGSSFGIVSATPVGLVSDGAGGAIHSHVSYSYSVEPHSNFHLHDIDPGGTTSGWPGYSGDFNGDPAIGVAIEGDGAGGVVAVVYRQTFAPPLVPPPPRPLYAMRLGPLGTYLWGPTDLTEPGLGTGHVAALYDAASGGGYFAWIDTRESGDPDLYVQRLDGAGAPASGWPAGGLRVCGATGDQFEPHLVQDGLGGAIVQWRDERDGSSRLYGHRVEAGGSLAPGIPADGALLPSTDDDDHFTNLASDGQGGCFVVRSGTTAGLTISHLHRLDATLLSRPGWPATGIALHTLSSGGVRAGLVADGAGGAFVSFRNGFGILPPEGLYAQHFAADGTIAPGWTADGYRLSGTGWDSQLVRSGSGAIAAWTDYRSGGQGVYAQRVVPDGPVATQLALVSARVAEGRIALHWYAADAAGLDATIQRRTVDAEWAEAGRATADGSGNLRYEEAATEPGARIAYRAVWVESGTLHRTDEVWVEVPARATLALSPPRPNPATGAVVLSVSIAAGEAAVLDVFDLGGRRLARRDLGGLVPGDHRIALDEVADFSPGLYIVRLAQGAESRQVRLVRMP